MATAKVTVALCALIANCLTAFAEPTPQWQLLSSSTGDIPAPPNNTGQADLLVLDVDKDGLDDYVIALWGTSPSVIWYRHTNKGFLEYPVGNQILSLEAGGTYHDIDSDGDLDLVFGTIYSSNKIYWWENPYPNFDPNIPWTMRYIKNTGANKHHDMIFCDFDNDGQDELIAFNQGARLVFMYDIPANPHTATAWASTPIYYWASGEQEGLASADVNLDGKIDIICAGRWLEYIDNQTVPTHIIDANMALSRVAVGQFIPGDRPEIILSLGDSTGPVKFYHWIENNWSATQLKSIVDHAHTIQVADFNLDGHLDFFIAEMADWGTFTGLPKNPDPQSIIFYGDGTGNFTEELISNQFATHQGKISDIDRDGDIDIIGKPFSYDIPRIDIWLNSFGANLNFDFTVNLNDMKILAGKWLSPDCSYPEWCENADLNHDSLVNNLDYTLLVKFFR